MHLRVKQMLRIFFKNVCEFYPSFFLITTSKNNTSICQSFWLESLMWGKASIEERKPLLGHGMKTWTLGTVIWCPVHFVSLMVPRFVHLHCHLVIVHLFCLACVTSINNNNNKQNYPHICQSSLGNFRRVAKLPFKRGNPCWAMEWRH